MPVVALKLRSYTEHKEQYSRKERYQLIRYIAKWIQRTGNIEIDVFGKENIPKEDGFIFYPNHQGMFDGVVMTWACEVPFSPVIKHELTQVPFVKRLFACLDSIPMEREDVRQSM